MTVTKSFKKVYVFKNGDSLDKVAKATGEKNGDSIWKDLDNKEVAKKRGKPENLQVGDKLMIFNRADAAKSLKAAVAALQSSVDAAQEKTNHYDGVISSDQKVTDALVKEAEANLKKFQRLSDNAELIDLCVEMGGALLSIGVAGAKGASASLKALEKAHEQVVEGIVDLNKEPVKFATTKIAEKHVESENKAVAAVSKVITLASNWTSPFWLGNAWARASSGQGTKQVFMGSLGDDLKKEIADTKKEGQARVAMYQASKQKSVATLAALKDQLKDAQDNLKQVTR